MCMTQGRVSMARQKPCRSRAGQSVVGVEKEKKSSCKNKKCRMKELIEHQGNAKLLKNMKVCMQNTVMVLLFAFHLKRDYTRQPFGCFRNSMKNQFFTWGYEVRTRSDEFHRMIYFESFFIE